MINKRMGNVPVTLLFALVVLSACQSLGRSSSGPVSYNLFFDPADHVKALMKAGDSEQAATVYQEQRAFFASKPKTQKLIDELAATLAGKHTSVTAEAERKLGAIPWPADPGQWKSIKEALAQAAAAIHDITEHAILTEGRYRPDYLPRLQVRLAKITEQLSGAAEPQFFAYLPAGQGNFFEIYPVPMNAKQLLSRTRWQILVILGHSAPQRLEAFASTYKTLIDSEFQRELGLRLYEAYQKQEAAEGRSGLPAVLSAVRATKANGLPLEKLPGTRVAVVEVTSQALLAERQIEFPIRVERDLPFVAAQVDIEAAFDAPEAKDADVLILLNVTTARNDRKIVSTKQIRSEFQSGTRTVPNPDYNMAQNRVNQAQLDLRRAGLQSATTDMQYCQGFGCIGKSIAQIANGVVEGQARRNVDAAMQALSNTPMTLEEPVYSPYAYTRTEISIAKEGIVNYYVVDRSAQLYFKSIVDTRQSQKFSVNYNLRQEDKDLEAARRGTTPESELAKFEEAPVTLRLSDILSQYQQRLQESMPLPTVMALREEILAEKNAALRTRKEKEFGVLPASIPEGKLNSVVVILNPGGVYGTGFYVADDLVLTNYHVIEGAQFAEMKLRNGQETFGKVIAKDIRLDLALIKTQMRGEPVTFFAGQNLPLGETVLTIGHPKGLEFSVTRGIISALREIASTSMPGGKKILFVQTDAAINPGNSGGPLYLNEWVIGVNTQKLAAVDVQGLGFAIHYSEVLNFLGINGVEVRKGGDK